MLFSAFTPLDLYQLSGDVPLAQRVYDSMKAQHGEQFSLDVGTRQEAFCFATSLAIARAAEKQEEAALQGLVDHVTETLPVFEQQFQLVPAHDETTSARKDALRFANRRPTSAWTYTAILSVLQDMLGSQLISYLTTPTAEVVRYPTAIGDQPMNLQRADVPRKIVRLLDPVSFTGVPSEVRYELVDAPIDVQSPGSLELVAGDKLVVEPNIFGIGETVTVEQVVPDQTIGGTFFPKNFKATFANAHTGGCLGFTHPYPSWTSTRRHHLVVVTPAAAQNLALRARLDRQMRKMVRASSTWSIVQSTDGLTLDTFEQNVPAVSNTSLVAFTL